MKSTLLLIAMPWAFSGPLCVAQTNEPVDDWKPCPSNQAGKPYPQYNSEGRVKFRIVAPEAKSVGCTFRDSSEFSKGEAGAWYGYTRPLDEGFHYYAIKIDGAEVPDPSSHYFYGSSRWGSAVEIPAKDQDFYALNNVPHGQLREVFYFSKTSTDRMLDVRFSHLSEVENQMRSVANPQLLLSLQQVLDSQATAIRYLESEPRGASQRRQRIH